MIRFAVGFLAVLLLANCAVAQDDQARDDSSGYHNREILLGLYQATGGLAWTDSSNWFQQRTGVCDWNGVICYSDTNGDDRKIGQIREINLKNNHLVGTVPTIVFEIPYLESLNVEANPDVDVDLSGISKGQFLNHMDLSNTQVNDISNIGDATGLEVLHITGLGLKGKLPNSLFELSNLVALFANYNSFSGTLPALISKLTSLDEIYLHDNDFTGQIPTEIGLLTDLEILTLSQNSFGGTLPTELNAMTSLQLVAIQRETDKEKGPGISGPIPAFDNHQSLTALYLENQKLNGEVDEDFLLNCPAGETVEADLSSNQLVGTIPSTLLDKKYLTLYLADNQIQLISEKVFDTVDNLCPDIGNWMKGAVNDLGCDAFLCPPGTWAPEGRTTEDDQCAACSDDAINWGRTSCTSSTPMDVQEREVLVNLYNVMGGRNWKSDTNWLNLDGSVCDWFGIDCTDNGSVSSINLRNNGLSGVPPQEIFLLSQLSVLNFDSNSIQFHFEGISAATNLAVLDLTSTDLPASSLDDLEELSSLTGLMVLSLASNNLAGTVPIELFGLPTLEELSISHNSFTGKLSTRIGLLTSLQRFGCDGNKLTGQFPTEIGSLKILQELSAGENQFSGSLPTELNSLTNLQTLSLQQTIASGGIGGPLLSFANLGQLTSLQLGSNKLTGTLPSDLLINSRYLESRVLVVLSDNLFVGEVPGQWSRFDKLFVDLAGNRITGISSGLCDANAWMDGDVSNYDCDAILCPKGKFNDIGRESDGHSDCQDCPGGGGSYFGARGCGNDPSEGNDDNEDSEIHILSEFFVATNGLGWKKNDGWTDSTDYCNFYGVECDEAGRVTTIDLLDNGLKGTTPSSIFKLPRLNELLLSKNDISFSFDGIGGAETLVTLYLDNTNLDSVENIGDAPNLITLHLEDNDLKGEVPYELFLLTDLRELDLGFNQLTGKVPNVIGALTSLETLRLYHNQFTGRLPAALGDLTNLRELNLAECNFDGTIPQEFNELTNLRFLSVQREGGIIGSTDIGINQGLSSVLGGGLTGPLLAFEKLRFITELYLGVNSLSGSVPYNFLDGVSDTNSQMKVDLTSNQLTGTLPASLTQFDKMSLYAADNRITDIAAGLCSKSNWLDGDVGQYQCDGILCPVGFYNALGRKGGSSTACQSCSSGTNGYLGSFECLADKDHQENSERAILESLYRAMGGESWLDQTNWMDSDESICTWFGIQCISDDQPSVTSIDLENNRLRNSPPTDIFSLPNLQTLNLQGNDIVFSFDGIQNAKNLEYLDLEETGTTSLAGVEKATGLKLLRVDRNNIQVFPQQVFNLASLEVLSMSENAFSEQEMPASFQSFSKLVYFGCGNCAFKGTIPAWLGSMANLEYVRLDQNALSGSLPTELLQLLNLKHLDLSDQASNGRGLTGSLLDFASQTQLTELFLQHNNFKGPIPTTLLQGVKNDELVTLDLSSNALTGTVPVELGQITDLNLFVVANLIEGLPQELCDKPWNDGNTGQHGCDAILCDKGKFNAFGRAIGDLGCFPCEETAFSQYYGSTFCGSIIEHTTLIWLYRNTGGPSWKSDSNWLRSEDHCTWEGITCHDDGEFEGLVKQIKLDDNNLIGILPYGQIWMLEGLEHVNLEKNDIVIPFSQVGNAKNLEEVILSETKTSSLEGIGGAVSLKSLHITNAELRGPIPSDLFQLTLLEELFLSHNALTGTLPTRIGQLKKLQAFYLFGNELKGTLPTELGFLASIEHLSLGENDFTGNIPRQISSLPLLEVLSLQSEEAEPCGMFCVGGGGLGGPLPALDGLPRLLELYLGHNSFTGSIPDHFLQGIIDKSQQITVDLSFNSLDGQIPKSLASFDDLQLLLGSNSISGIPDEICAKSEWMNGEVANGCEAILCSPGTFNELGRRVDSKTLCDPCTYPGSCLDYGCTACGPVLADEMDEPTILYELYDAAGGSQWSDSGGWKSDGVAFCDWHGITCMPVGELGKMTVTEISLAANNLNGIIPSILYHLPELKKLDVRDNDVSITFNAIHQAENLEELYLDQTRVSKLNGIGKASSLKILHLHKNSFGWQSIPEELFDLTNLEGLDISDSMFSGTLSTKIGNMASLKSFSLIGNQLTGQIPSEIGKLQNVKELELSNNNWFGTLPESVTGLVSLEAFFLDNDKNDLAGISGPLRSFTGMPKLRELHLSKNSFTGTVPNDFLADVDDPDSLINIHLDGNQLLGTVPAQLSAFSKLNIYLQDNLFTAIGDGLCEESLWLDGSVGRFKCEAILCPAGEYSPIGRQSTESNACEPCPEAEDSPYLGVSFCLSIQKKNEKEILGKLFQATNGENWKNKEGWMDDAFDICQWYGISCREGSTVESILLGSNRLTGTPPTELFELPNLKFLWLYSNPIDFSFEGIGQASSLRSLLLDSTKLRSLAGIGSARSLVDVDVRFNNLEGTVPKELDNLVNLQSFTCSENKFSGPVPELTALRKLNTLRMSNNQLTGTLPAFASHPELKSLDLSENMLGGSIPSNFFETVNEQQPIFLDLSENRLTGTVPGELSRFADLTIYLRENRIEGIDPSLCSLDSWNEGDVGSFQCDGILCPTGTYSPTGRASRTGATCEPCSENMYFGIITCSGSSGATARFGAVLTIVLGLLLF